MLVRWAVGMFEPVEENYHGWAYFHSSLPLLSLLVSTLSSDGRPGERNWFRIVTQASRDYLESTLSKTFLLCFSLFLASCLETTTT